MKRVIITKAIVGICHMQVCAMADATDEEILALCNAENPAGTSQGWGRVIRKIDEEGFMSSKNMEPVQCAKFPERMHFLIEC